MDLLDEKDLQAIAQMMGAMEDRLDKKMDEKLAGVEERLDTKFAAAEKRIAQNTATLMDTRFEHRFNLLAENQQVILEKLERLDDMDILDTRITALEAMVKKLNRDMTKLKQAN